jgi:hypothetical protein
MATYTITGHPEYGIPPGSSIRIDSVAFEKPPRRGQKQRKYKERHLYWTGIIDGELTRNFDVGRYVYKIHNSPEGMTGGFRYVGEFNIGVTDENFAAISRMKPQTSKAAMTTDGVRWTCNTIAGCNKTTTSRVAAVLHEAAHKGIDLLEHKDPELALLTAKTSTPVDAPVIKRGPGRPPNPRPAA